jgi:ribosomal-protein-alanine N-acetyltransferase
MIAIHDIQTQDSWRMRRAALDDVDGLHALAANPLVYRYLFDGVPPDKEFIARRAAESVTNAGATGLSTWFLENDSSRYAGCVELRSHSSLRSAEITYLLDPRFWGRGLALRMAWTAITHAFSSSQIDTIIAGGDLPNAASLAVMRRLGMRFHKDVHYPLGAGAEYVLRRGDGGPLPKLGLISLTDAYGTKDSTR